MPMPMNNLREYPGVVITEMVERDPSWMATYLIDNLVVGSGQGRDALPVIQAWCEDQFGPMGSSDPNDSRWFLSQWDAFTFTNPVEATAFKVRWF